MTVPNKRRPIQRSTPAGEHRPVLLAEVLDVLRPQPGEFAVDCTLGFGGHALAIVERIAPTGMLIAVDWDAANLEQAKVLVETAGCPVRLHHGNFAGLPGILAAQGVKGVDLLLADVGVSSMQIDDPQRGFSYVRDGPLDMRMDRSRGRTAAEVLASIDEADLARALAELGDEPHSAAIAHAIVKARQSGGIESTGRLSRIIGAAVGQPVTRPGGWRLRSRRGEWTLHPAARTFQALRILVNRELANLRELLRVLPQCLRPGGRAAVICFHSGEDRLVKAAFRDGLREGVYASAADEPIRATYEERHANPRSRSAKLRWAVRSAGA